MTVRFAIYFAPVRDSALWQVGCRWLGRDPETGARYDPPSLPQCSAEHWANITAAARRYGFHATLKAPFALAEGRTQAELMQAMDEFAARQQPFPLPALEVAELGDFLALRLAQPSTALEELAAACVTRFDVFRRPPEADETARRLASGLTANERALLIRWGYPYVLGAWRFHMTLTERLAADTRQALQRRLADYFAPALAHIVEVRDIALFVQERSGSEFMLTRRFALGGGESHASRS